MKIYCIIEDLDELSEGESFIITGPIKVHVLENDNGEILMELDDLELGINRAFTKKDLADVKLPFEITRIEGNKSDEAEFNIDKHQQ